MLARLAALNTGGSPCNQWGPATHVAATLAWVVAHSIEQRGQKFLPNLCKRRKIGLSARPRRPMTDDPLFVGTGNLGDDR